MSKFADKTGARWEIEITHGHLKKLKAEHGLDLRDALKKDGNTLAEVVADPDRFGQLLWFLCGPQAEKAGVTPEEFAFRFNGQAVRDAAAALWSAVMDFFQGPRAAREAEKTFRTGVDRMDGALETVWQKAGASLTSGNGAGNSPGSPDSTPAPAPSAS